jgi:hypothetical protein
MNQAHKINMMELKNTNIKAWLGVIIPAGISRINVLGFCLSISLSAHLLNAIAALLANTIHKITKANFCKLNVAFSIFNAKKNPTIANGNAKIVWLNLMRDK